jgi:hypothetical protein
MEVAGSIVNDGCEDSRLERTLATVEESMLIHGGLFFLWMIFILQKKKELQCMTVALHF